MSIDAMKQALEALEFFWDNGYRNIAVKQKAAITALRAAIEQAQGLAEKVPARGTLLEQTLGKVWDEMPHPDYQKEMEQEPVAWMHPSWIDPDTRGWESDSFNAIPIEGWVPVFTAPHRWQGLTDAELAEFSEAKLGAYDLCLEVEAKLKEKNT